MLNDEQILLKTEQLLESLGVPQQKPDKLLRELDEIELEALDGILDDMKGEDVAFNKLFDGKFRKVIDFPTMDNSTELGKFGEFFKKQDFDVDWEKGLVSAEREVGERSIEDIVGQLMGGPEADRQSKKKKIQMKVGKFFAKVADLSSKRDILYQKVFEHMDKMNYIGDHGKIDVSWKVSGKMINAALDEKEQEDYNRINTQIGLYIPNPGVAGPAGYHLTNLVIKMAKYWQTNAGYIKKEINKLDNDKYSIIITRHPIDVMRMSDFENITSCHSPPRRSGGTNEYYKCAVAEARGHGAIAYVVETDDLLHETNTSNIESAEQEIQDGEIFYDEERPESTSGVSLEPVSRVRLRQMRYYDTDTPKRWDDGTELAVPEKAIYGVGIPGLADRVVKWAEENQKEAIRDIPETGEMVNLDRFWMFGGSYEDTSGTSGRKSLLSALTGIDEMHFTGKVKQNTETEETLDANAISGLLGRYRNDVARIENEWNQRYAAAGVSAEVHGDDEGGVYIEVEARITFTYTLDEFSSLPNSYPTGMHAFDSINDWAGDIFEIDTGFVNKFSNTTVHIGCRFNLEHPEIGESALIYDPDGFDAFCAEIDKLDDRRDAFKENIDQFLKQEGYLEGGEYIKLAYEIEDAPFESYEWDVRSDGEDPTESYESTAAVSHDFNPEALGVSPQVLIQILDSRDWRLLIRKELLKHPRTELGVEYYLDIGNSSAMASGEDIEYTIEFKITADDPDARVELFRELTTGATDDEDILKNMFDWAIKQMINARLPAGQQQNLDERLVKTWKGFLGRI